MPNSTSLQTANFPLLLPLNPNRVLDTRTDSSRRSNPKSLSLRALCCGSKLRESLIRVPAIRAAARSEISQSTDLRISRASDVVREFYDGINRRDLAAVERLIGEECVYEDLVFSQPFVGRKAIFEFFKKFTESISEDLQFVIDDISDEDTSAIGVTWHLDWKGKPFPFSKGCSFYRLEVLDGRRQIIYGRDCVEPATKPGETALVLIRGVAGILQRFPQLANWM